MKIAVWDTYVKRTDGKLMHFDILVPSSSEENRIFNFGKQYLAGKSFKTSGLTSKECQFCHIEEAPERILEDIQKHGYAIIEIQNCN